MNKKLKLITILVQIIVLLFASCNLEIPTPKELRAKNTLENEVKAVILQNEGFFSDQYSIYPGTTLSYLEGEKTEIHYIAFSCYNENLNNLERSKVDSVSNVLATVILDNIEFDTSFSRIVIKMVKRENSVFTEKEWNYSKEFVIDELKK